MRGPLRREPSELSLERLVKGGCRWCGRSSGNGSVREVVVCGERGQRPSEPIHN